MVQLGFTLCLTAVAYASAALAKCVPVPPASPPVDCNGKTYTYNSLAGFGAIPSDARDQFGDTISTGSSLSIKNWKKDGKKYTGTMYGLPDRGWNTKGTQNTIPRVHIYDITFTPSPAASVAKPSGPNIKFAYKKTILLTDPRGTPLTGLDPDFTASGGLTFPGFPVMPTSTYPGDGFGGAGPGGKRICLDAEAIFLADDGAFWISDEYGPFVYKFDKDGKMLAAIQPPDALLPVRKGAVSYNSNTPPIYNATQIPVPGDPDHGRQNNQGFEGLTVSPDGKTLFVMLQSAARQEGGASSSKRRNTRFLKYSITKDSKPRITYEAEWVIPLPTFKNAAGNTRVAAQSEIHYVSDTQFLVLPRDSSAGRGQADPLSRYRHVDVVDVSAATNIKGAKFDDIKNGNITSGGIENPSDTLVSGITPAVLCPFLDYNLNEQLNKFTASDGTAVRNGPLASDPTNHGLGLLNEKWEALALVPVNDVVRGADSKDEYYLFTLSDNDFITNKGFINFGRLPYTDDTATVPFLENQALVFKITLPKGSKPLVA
ncbi:esterase-like activity of phytase-domain-containing protein [Lasiosphaeria miniovina]|uniref:Esterase-like activity of phytase-domain-containing protein n=1 Tax=Lasiosphaeria miniovina TaxID=1954250 RepID=A0AA40E9R8_9PEZI|nr:esterase-like activity of phytase-domain-containing protein [Lasiosphaeria miniovina]KAK0727593.1 esterase-like activity of phytase-domain-containing protein [Lasiosphaeria miniovina]